MSGLSTTNNGCTIILAMRNREQGELLEKQGYGDSPVLSSQWESCPNYPPSTTAVPANRKQPSSPFGLLTTGESLERRGPDPCLAMARFIKGRALCWLRADIRSQTEQ